VALNLAFLAPGEIGGMETYARELARALAARRDTEVVLLLNRLVAGERAWRELGECHELPANPRRRVDWVRADQLLVPRAASRAGAEVIHSLASTGPAAGSLARVTTIHDLAYRVMPGSHSRTRRWALAVLVPLAARRSQRLLADSAAICDELVRDLGIARAKIDVAPLGVRVAEQSAVTAEAALRATYALADRPVVLSVSARRRHKNVPRLLRAVAAIAPERRPVLVMPGYRTQHEGELRELADRLDVAGDVRFLPWVAPADLEGLYRVASCSVFPSLYEGFGLPVIEAMARGVPVACSDRGAVREAAGDAALAFDPEDAEAIRMAVERLLADPALADDLRRRGRERARLYSWDRTAELTRACYERALADAE
jgi:glycosyltransferase involved in cell wall biosynthesis